MANKEIQSDNKDCYRAWQNYTPVDKLGGFKITHIPQKPSNFKSIANYGKKKENRTFPYEEFPNLVVERDDNGNITDTSFEGMSEEEEVAYLKTLVDRWQNGIWFYNGDNLEYITGDHWYYLNIMKINVKYKGSKGRLKRGRKNPYFIDGDRNWFYLWKQIEMLNPVAGMIFVTKRRGGKTLKACSTMLSAATREMEVECGIQAQNGEFAKKLFSELVSLWKNIPRHELFFPTHSGNDSPTTSLEFRTPTKTRGSSKFFSQKEVLDSSIDWAATTPAAYDGRTMYRFLLDEASKINGCDVNDLVGIVKETLGDGASYIGKMIITSTAENIGGKTLKQFETLWKESDPKLVSEMGQTPSGFYRFFQGADIGYRYDPEVDGKLSAKFDKPTIDHWGYSDREVARSIILELRKGKTGDALVKFIRKFPLSEEEAFMYAENTCPFDTVKINQQITYNDDLRLSGNLDLVRGNFFWSESYRKVDFAPAEKGRWLVSLMPEPEDRNQYEFSMNVARPTRNYFSIGIDPFDHNQTEDKKRFSNGASATLCLGYSTHPHRGFVCMYNNRPATANLFYEDMLMQAMFYSSPVIVENQKHGLVNWFQDKGFGGFIESDPLDLKKTTEGVSTRSLDTRNTMVNGMVAFVYESIGKKNVRIPNEHGELQFEEVWGDCPFDDFLRELVQFNNANWTPSDMTVAAMLALLSTKKAQYTVQEASFNIEDFIHLSE